MYNTYDLASYLYAVQKLNYYWLFRDILHWLNDTRSAIHHTARSETVSVHTVEDIRSAIHPQRVPRRICGTTSRHLAHCAVACASTNVCVDSSCHGFRTGLSRFRFAYHTPLYTNKPLQPKPIFFKEINYVVQYVWGCTLWGCSCWSRTRPCLLMMAVMSDHALARTGSLVIRPPSPPP